MDLLKYLFEKPALMDRIAKWQLLLSEFDITYVTQKAIKGQALADHLAAHSLLAFQCTNNVAEYEACIAGQREAIILNVKKLQVFGDSQLIINQINGNWETKDENLIPYHVYRENLIEDFKEITFFYMPRVKNQFADALVALASMLEIPKGVAEWELTVELQEEPAFCLQIDEGEPPSNDLPWYKVIKEYLEHQKYPEGATLTNPCIIQRLAAQFVITGGILYKRSFNQVLLRCTDCCKHVKKCFKCQEHANQIHTPASELYNLTTPWPFSVWGLDIIGKISPKASNGHEYILVAVDYFTKWIEAASCTTIAASHVVKFIKNNIISRYGVPQAIITYNGTPFVNKRMGDFLDKLKIQRHLSSPYQHQMNGKVEVVNKTIICILEKIVKTYRDWSEMLPYALWAYQTYVRSATGATPYELIYGMEAVLPIEIEIPSLRVLLESEVEESEGNKQVLSQREEPKTQDLELLHPKSPAKKSKLVYTKPSNQKEEGHTQIQKRQSLEYPVRSQTAGGSAQDGKSNTPEVPTAVKEYEQHYKSGENDGAREPPN
ncbi:uncharacterized protein LOC131226947 [Magnolia sinica]|uniref:uncharacterized protein LOC131226947 n=1 Tax=Magnolia sinica TaxID=86752 RepID=UPI00265AAF52|nr:uncharacterized protein LOC131226947 [Magnolia sinica]